MSATLALASTLVAGGEVLVPPPAFAARWSPTFRIYRQGRRYWTHLDPASLRPAIDVQYYVDPISGSDGNDGLQRGAPKKTLACITAAPTGSTIGIRIINLAADYVARGSNGWNNRQAAKNLVVEVEGGFRFISAGTTNTSGPVFTKSSGFTAVYQTSFAASSVSVIDVSIKTTPANPVTGSTVPNVPPSYRVHGKVASAGLVDSTPGSYFLDTANQILYVATVDGRAPDGSLIVSGTSNNGRMGSTAGLTTYVQGVDFVGGATPFLALTGATANTGTVVFANCSFQGASTGAGGLAIQGKLAVYVWRSGAYFNALDGFNYHCFTSGGDTGTADSGSSPTVFEWESCAWGNGTTGASASTSDNASTSHDFSAVVRLGNVYVNSDDGPLVDTNSAMSWNLGLTVGRAAKDVAGSEPVRAGSSGAGTGASLWLDGCVVSGAANQVAAAATNAAVYVRNMAMPARPGGSGDAGSVAFY